MAALMAPARPRVEPGWDLVDGIWVERQMGNLANYYATTMSEHLAPYVRRNKLGVVHNSSAGFQCAQLDGGRLRMPDLSFVGRAKLKEGRPAEGWDDYPPDLVVEVVSPNDDAQDVHRKAQMWLRGGVALVWVVWPREQQVVAHHPDGSAQTYSVGDAIDGEAVVPGFVLPLATLFADPLA